MSVQAEYRRLGKSGLRVSVPILGCMSYGDPKWNSWVIAEQEALPVMKAAWDAGINTFNTANMYSNGLSEEIIKNFMVKYDIARENLTIMTKIWCLVDKKNMSNITPFASPSFKNMRDNINQGGLSRAAVFNQVRACLERIGTEYIDVLIIHMVDVETPFEETMRALHDLVVTGKVRYIGASNIRAWQFIEMNNIAQLNGWTQFSCLEVEHSLLNRFDERELFAYCNFKGIGILGYSALQNGTLARPIGTETTRTKQAAARGQGGLRESDEKIVKRVQELAERHSWTMSQVALAWSVTKTTSPIVGINSIERVAGSIPAGKTLTNEEIKYLEESYENRLPRW